MCETVVCDDGDCKLLGDIFGRELAAGDGACGMVSS